jgi:hypothetical protein
MVHAQNWTWAESAGGALPDEGEGCTIDNAGNVYMSGFFFSSSINFNSGNSLSNGGICDGFVVKYNPSGNSVWASKIKGNGEDKATRCAVDLAGNVFTTGYFKSSSIQFGGNNAHNVSNFDNSGNSFDAFIVKYNSSGTPQWFHAIGKTDDDGGNGLTTDSIGNVYVTGWFRAPSITLGSFTLTNQDPAGGTADMFIIKYDSNGNVLWAKSAGSTNDDKGNNCVVDASGNVIVAGYCKGDSIKIGGNYYLNHGGKDVFVAKYTANGTLLAARTLGGTGGEEAFSCSVDLQGNIFVTGNFSSSSVVVDTITISNTGSNAGAFLIKLNPSLTALWARSASSSTNDEARGCSTDKYGNTVITGVFTGSTITFGSTVLSNNGDEDIFLVKYDSQGNIFWAKKIGKSKADGTHDCFMDNNGKIVVAGYYTSSSLTMDNITVNNSYTGIATSDVFIATTCNTEKSTDIKTACNAYKWIDGKTYTASNNTAFINFPMGSSKSCDSMVTLNLTINAANITVTNSPPTLMANAASASYRWLDCDNSFAFLPGATNQRFTATTTGNYAVEVTENGCKDTSACFFVQTVGIINPLIDYNISIYPNPVEVGNNITIAIDGAQPKVRPQVHITDVTGRVIYEQTIITALATIPFTFSSGIYFLKVNEGYHSFSQKLVVQ